MALENIQRVDSSEMKNTAEQVKKETQKGKSVEAQKQPEQTIDQQKFIENKFIRLDSVFKKEAKKVNGPKQALDGWKLDTKRENVSFKIEKDYGAGRNADLTIKDGKDTYNILLEYPETTLQYRMTVVKNGQLQGKTNANAIATKYIGML